MVIKWIIIFYGQKIENTEYRHDIDYHNINTFAGISIILVHLQDRLMQKLHWKFEVNCLNRSWDIMHAKTAFSSSGNLRKTALKLSIYFQSNDHL